MKERLSKSLTINPVEGQMDSESTESSCSKDSDSAVETSISMEFQKREKDLNPTRGRAQTLGFEKKK